MKHHSAIGSHEQTAVFCWTLVGRSFANYPAVTDTWRTWLRRGGFLLMIFSLSACSGFPAVDLAPKV